MGKVKTYYFRGDARIRNRNISVISKISAVSSRQAWYYCCVDIKEELEIEDYISFMNWNATGMDSTMNWIRYNITSGVQYSIDNGDGTYRKIEARELKELVHGTNYDDPFQ